MSKPSMSSLVDILVSPLRCASAPRTLPMVLSFGLLITSSRLLAAEPASGVGDGNILTGLLLVLLVAIVVASLVIVGLIFWTRKQEHAAEMMLFCLKYLVHSQDEGERCASAKALGKANDAGALLVLLDVSLDEEEPEAVRAAAADALHEMGAKSRKFKRVIAELEAEKEHDNIPGLIGALTAHFEDDEKPQVQSAYVIGRLHTLVALHGDARQWFSVAEQRNRRTTLYGNRIANWIETCNARLLEEADDAFKSADYLAAKEQYAVLDHGLNNDARQRSAIYLRSACVYCKLEEYQIADQSLLQALDHDQEIDLSMTLVPLLQEITTLDNHAPSGKFEELKKSIDKRVDAIMQILLEKEF